MRVKASSNSEKSTAVIPVGAIWLSARAVKR
jgi:hypothetical protein